MAVRLIDGGIFSIMTDTDIFAVEAFSLDSLYNYICELEDNGSVVILVSKLNLTDKKARIPFKTDKLFKTIKRERRKRGNEQN